MQTQMCSAPLPRTLTARKDHALATVLTQEMLAVLLMEMCMLGGQRDSSHERFFGVTYKQCENKNLKNRTGAKARATRWNK